MIEDARAAGDAARLLRSAAAMGLYVVLLLAIYVVHALWWAVDVVFYSALADAAVATAAVAAALWTLRWFRVLGRVERLQLLAICLLGGYAFAISVPTVIDRSLSFYLLEKLEQRGGGIRADAIERVIRDEYMQEYRVADARLTEQLASGTIEIVEGCVLLTAKGRRIAGWSSAFRNTLLPKRRLLMGEYSDQLTDPLRHSRAEFDYACAAAAVGQPVR